MYDATGRTNNMVFECVLDVIRRKRTLCRNAIPIPATTTILPITPPNSPVIPQYRELTSFQNFLAPQASNDFDSASVSSSKSNISIENSISLLRNSLGSLESKTQEEVSALRSHVVSESSALRSLVENLQTSIDQPQPSILIDRSVAKNKSSDSPILLLLIPVSSPRFSTSQAFSIRVSFEKYTGLSKHHAELLLKCTGAVGEEITVVDSSIPLDGSVYYITGILSNSYIGLEISITSFPFTQTKRIPFAECYTIELYTICDTDNAVCVSETTLFPVQTIEWTEHNQFIKKV